MYSAIEVHLVAQELRLVRFDLEQRIVSDLYRLPRSNWRPRDLVFTTCNHNNI